MNLYLSIDNVQLNPVESMSRCQFVHDLRQCPVMVGSPQTQPQRDQVTRVINRLMSQNQSALFRTISEGSLMEPPPSPVNGRSPRSGHTTPVKAASQSSELLARHGAASSKQGASPEDSTQNVTDKVFSVSLSQTAPDPHLNPPSESPRTQSREKAEGTAKKEFSFTASIKSLLKPKSSTKVAKSDADIDDTSNMTIDQAVMDVEQPANSATPKPPGSAQPSSGSFIRNFRLGNITKG